MDRYFYHRCAVALKERVTHWVAPTDTAQGAT